jgi:nitrogen regulatory protein P-II 2
MAVKKTAPTAENMKMVTAIIKPFKLDDVRDAIIALGVEGLTAQEVRGFGRQKGQTEIFSGSHYKVTFLPKIRIDVAVLESQVDKIIKAIIKAASTGRVGDGKIFVTPLEKAVRIRTGEENAQAL